jgi:hypothetical protein
MKRLVFAVALLGGIKALLPSPTHIGVWELIEVLVAACITIPLLVVYYGKKAQRTTQRNAIENGAGYPAPDA